MAPEHPLDGDAPNGTPSEQARLNVTMDLSPERYSRLGGSPRQLNSTIDLSPDCSPVRGGTPQRLLNTTRSGERHPTVGTVASPSTNLNETFIADSERTPSERSRRVTRNLSYVIRQDAESPNNNLTARVPAESPLNATFSFEADGEGDVTVTRGSQNTSMEDLNSRVASQIRSKPKQNIDDE